MPWESEAKFYETIGRFAVSFEHVCRYMEVCIRTILDGRGLVDTRVQDILLADKTAEPLRQLLQNLVGEVLAKVPADAEVCAKVFGRIQELIQVRNRLIHSKWMPFAATGDDEVQRVFASGERLKATKRGAGESISLLQGDDVDAMLAACDEATKMLGLIWRCLLRRRTLGECFSVANGELLIYEAALKPDSLVVKRRR